MRIDPETNIEGLVPDEPAWVSRFARGDCQLSPFIATEIASQVRELLVYKAAFESMARQMIHPKMTALEMATMQLRGSSKESEAK